MMNDVCRTSEVTMRSNALSPIISESNGMVVFWRYRRMENGEWKSFRIARRSAKRRHYPIIPSPHYPIKNVLRPWGLNPCRARMRMRAILLSTMFRLFPCSLLFILRLCRSCGALKSSHPFNPPAHAGGYRYAAPMGLDGLGKPGAKQSVIWTCPILQKPHHEKNGL